MEVIVIDTPRKAKIVGAASHLIEHFLAVETSLFPPDADATAFVLTNYEGKKITVELDNEIIDDGNMDIPTIVHILREEARNG